MSSEATQQSEYTIEPFDDADVGEFLDLHGRIFDPDHDRDWFAWKYADNPYVDPLPILVARRGGDLVGARPFFHWTCSSTARATSRSSPATRWSTPTTADRGCSPG